MCRCRSETASGVIPELNVILGEVMASDCCRRLGRRRLLGKAAKHASERRRYRPRLRRSLVRLRTQNRHLERVPLRHRNTAGRGHVDILEQIRERDEREPQFRLARPRHQHL